MVASRTVLAIGPAVSWLWDIGIIPVLETIPTVGFIPTIEFMEEGPTTEPSVSVPIAAAQKPLATATAEPELEPPGVLSVAYALRTCPPRLDHQLEERVERKFAHSLRFVLPSKIAPALRSRSTR